jgi:hypothetical protein
VADVDFATCEQPDELIQLAWNAGLDRMLVIREGTDAAGLLLASEREKLVALFWPVPRRLEAVRRWSENPSRQEDINAGLRPWASAVVPGCIGGALVANALDGGEMVIVGMIVAMNVVLGVVFKVMIGTIQRWRVARLDEDAALAIVLDALRAGMTRTPPRIPRACEWIRDGFARASARAGAP